MNKLSENRQWGSFIRYTHNEPSTVKILNIKAGEEFSLQYHNHRKEFWKILSGHPRLIVGDKIIEANVMDEFEINEKVNHRISAINDDVMVLEIGFGNFDEDDIVRLDDKYGRT